MGFWMTLYHPVTWYGTCTLPILPSKWPVYIALIHYSAMDQAISKKFGSKYASIDFCKKSTFQVQKGRGLGSRNPISKFRDPIITYERIELSASNLVKTWRMEHSCVWTTKHPKWVWPGSRDPVSKFLDPYNVWTNRNLNEIWYTNIGWTFPL